MKKYYITKENESKIIWGFGLSDKSSLKNAKECINNYSEDYKVELKTLECSKKLYGSIEENGWSKQKYIIYNNFAMFWSEFKDKEDGNKNIKIQIAEKLRELANLLESESIKNGN